MHNNKGLNLAKKQLGEIKLWFEATFKLTSGRCMYTTLVGSLMINESSRGAVCIHTLVS